MKDLGIKFLNTLLDVREAQAVEVCVSVEDFLFVNKIPYEVVSWQPGLMASFFGQYYILHINPNATKHVVIGKGIVYDSGGYSLKPSHGMKDMFFDRNGAFLTIAHCINTGQSGIIFFAANLLNNSVLPGIILHDAYSKEKILIDNTDAEGRIGLAYCLGLAKSLKYKKALTIATLTGAAVQVTGERVAALVHSNKPKDLIQIMHARVTKGLQIHPAPYSGAYDASIETPIKYATISNMSSLNAAGSSTAFSFLKRFFKGHLLHLDMAAMMKTNKGNGLVWGLKEVKFLTSLLR